MIWGMKPVAFDDLERLPVVKYYEAAFRKATGVSLKVVPPGDVCPRPLLGPEENAFCSLAAGTPAGCAALPGDGDARTTQRGQEAGLAATPLLRRPDGGGGAGAERGAARGDGVERASLPPRANPARFHDGGEDAGERGERGLGEEGCARLTSRRRSSPRTVSRRSFSC